MFNHGFENVNTSKYVCLRLTSNLKRNSVFEKTAVHDILNGDTEIDFSFQGRNENQDC
jgi:hypothetical protein